MERLKSAGPKKEVGREKATEGDPRRRPLEQTALRLWSRSLPTPGECCARKATPRRRLPVLWRADEKDFPTAARLESQPRTTTFATILRMSSASIIPLASTRFFQSHGRGFSELCQTAGNDRQVMRFYPIQFDSTLSNPSASPLEEALPACGNAFHLELRPHLLDRLQTQNA